MRIVDADKLIEALINEGIIPNTRKLFKNPVYTSIYGVPVKEVPCYKVPDERFYEATNNDKWYCKGYNRAIAEINGDAEEWDRQARAAAEAFGHDGD